MLHRRQLRWLGHLGRMANTRVARQALYSTMWQPGRSRRPGTQLPNLSDTYCGLVSRYLPRNVLRRVGGRQATWWTVCQNRVVYKSLLP
jgi:hypothetical protein